MRNVVKAYRLMFVSTLCVLALSLLLVIPNKANADIPMRNGVPSLAPIVEMVKGSVVNISTTGEAQITSNPFLDDPFFRRFFELPEGGGEQMRKTQSLGSGVILDAKNGYVVTNHHVVENATEIVVGLEDGREVKAKLIGSDPDSDIAVVQIAVDNLVEAKQGDSEELRVGDYVMAIGSPFGLQQTVTTGIVSALGRSGLNIERLEDFIQTDASINPGNSGGALMNLSGELVGINTAILSRSGGNIGIGFAIPINMVDSIVLQLVENGEVRRGLLGVSIQDITDEVQETFGLKVTEGALVTGINEGSAAEKAGIELGDVITRVDEVVITSSSDLVKTISLRTAGDTVTVEVIRGKKTLKLKAILDNRNSAAQTAKNSMGPNDSKNLGKYSEKLEGIIIVEDAESKALRIVQLADDSQGFQIGLQPDDLIITVNKVRVENLNDVGKVLRNSSDDRVILTIVREGRRFYAVLE